MRTGFPLRRLDELALSVDYGVTASASIANVGPQFLRITDIQDDGVDWATVPFCEAAAADVERARLEGGDIVFARTGATTGKSFLIRACPERAVFASYLIRVRPNPREIEPRYLAWYFQTPHYWMQIASSASGTAQPGVNATKLKALSVPTPPLAQQRRIADILDKADEIRRKRKEAIALTQEMQRSAFQEMFGAGLACVEAGPLPNGWQRKTIAELKAPGNYTCVGGPFGSNLTSRDYVDDGVPVIRGTNLGAKHNVFIDEDFVFVSAAKAKDLVQNMAVPGDVVFTQRGTLGQVAVIPKTARYPRYVISQSQMKLTPNSELITATYLHAFFTTPRMRAYILSHALTTGVPHINLAILRATPVAVPPMPAQRAFGALVARIESSRAHLRDAVAAADALFGALISRTFSGSLETAC